MVTVAIRALDLEHLVKILDEVGVGVATFLPTPPTIPSLSDSTAMIVIHTVLYFAFYSF
jgi:hypothetical protein